MGKGNEAGCSPWICKCCFCHMASMTQTHAAHTDTQMHAGMADDTASRSSVTSSECTVQQTLAVAAGHC